jgi:hypothetical protein
MRKFAIPGAFIGTRLFFTHARASRNFRPQGRIFAHLTQSGEDPPPFLLLT